MSKRREPDLMETIGAEQGRMSGPTRAQLMVVADGVAATHPLPDSGEIVIGRSPSCDVWIDHPSVSRKHAVLRTDSGSVAIEDLGSANGTQVRGERLSPNVRTPVAAGEVVEIGSTTLVVQNRTDASAPRIWTHGYFEVRLEDACDEARDTGSELALIRVRSVGDASDPAIQAATAACFGDADVGAYGPGQYEILVTDVAPTEARERAAELVAECRERGANVKVAAACFPAEAKSAHSLLAQANAMLRDRPAASVDGTVVADPAMRKLHAMIEKVAPGKISVLLLGETGVGKEILASTVHRTSPRAGKPFVALNCAALAETLLEAELFGHEKGAFTGATSAKAGLLETADGGTVFLDEVGEMPMSVQVKLLRVLEERAVMRVGGRKPIPIDVRIVSATNRDLEAEVTAGSFREDLLYRLNGVTLRVPPLRERVAEIEPLCVAFAKEAADDLGQAAPPALSPEALDMVRAYRWPGNIRELRNVIERAVLLCDGAIEPEHLPTEKMDRAESPAPAPAAAPSSSKKQQIIDALAQCGGNQTRAAKLLGVTRRTLTNWLNKYDIPRPIKNRD